MEKSKDKKASSSKDNKNKKQKKRSFFSLLLKKQKWVRAKKSQKRFCFSKIQKVVENKSRFLKMPQKNRS